MANISAAIPTISSPTAAPDDERSSGRRVWYWAATIVAAIAFLLPGMGNLIHFPHIARDMAHLGYPAYFMSILGTWKVLGGVTILLPGLPRLKEWAYAGMIFDLSGGAASRAVAGDGARAVIIPLAIALVVVASWALRPEGRTLHRR